LAVPRAIQEVDVVERLHETVPLGLHFTDSEGHPFELRQAFQGEKPVLLTLVYYRCQALCDLVVSGLVRSLNDSGLQLGRDFGVVTASIDPSETPDLAARRRRGHLQALGQKDHHPDWAFLTGDEASIHQLAESVGFRYSYDEKTRQFAHAATVFVLTPEGRISRYLYGMDFPPRDLKLALLEAANGRVGTSFDRILMKCFRYDPADRRYHLYMMGFIRGGALLVFFALAALLWKLWRRELRAKRGAAV
jgi:protein SCO1/2